MASSCSFCISQQALEWVLLQSLKEETPAMSYAMPVKSTDTTTFYLKMLFKEKKAYTIVSLNNIYKEQ